MNTDKAKMDSGACSEVSGSTNHFSLKSSVSPCLRGSKAFALLSLLVLSLGVAQVHAEEPVAEQTEEVTAQQDTQNWIPIRRFAITGSRRFSEEDLNRQLLRFTGRKRTAADVESAREALEMFFREQGYADATVSIVEPRPANGTVALEVRENLPPVAVAVTDTPPADAAMENEKVVKAGATLEALQKELSVQAAAEKKAAKADDSELLPEDEAAQAPAQQDNGFTIKGFIIGGTYLFSQDVLQQQVKSFAGRGKTAADIEGARDALERFFHEQGYPAMLVNIPAQSSANRIFRLEVIENRIGNVLVSGNQWISTEKILRDVPSILPGTVLNLKDLQREINSANRNPDVKIVPEMLPGKAPESIDIALKVQDSLPLHGSLELNNRASHDTTELRLNAGLHYDNLWQRDHSISLQYQVSPQNSDEVEVVSGSYTLPLPWNREEKLVVYGVVSNSNTNSAAGYSNLGKGNVIGSRLIMPLQAGEGFFHTLVAGVDYKDFSETVGLAGGTGEKTPISYFPVSAAYSAYLKDSSGLTSFNGGLSVIFRGAVSDPREFESKRYRSSGNPITLTAGVERSQQLPGEFTLLAKVDGQITDQPLISNEQYTAGGVESVRGYHDSESSGDNALHGVIELAAPELLKQTCKEKFSVSPYLFYDVAHLWVRDPLPGQNKSADLQGIGFGLRGTLLKGADFQTDIGFPLHENKLTKAGEPRVHFKVRYQF